MRSRTRYWFLRSLALALAASAVAGSWARGQLATESFSLPYGPGNPAAAPYQDMIVNTSPAVTTWGEKGAAGLQGSQSVFYNGSAYVNEPASTVAFKFNIGGVVDSLNAAYGAGNWTISNPTLSMQYTYYANNSIFGGGAGSFETYWVANNNWAFGNGGSAGNSYNSNVFVPGVDPAYATSASTLSTWAGSLADLGSTTYNWLSPANNPNYVGWSTDKTGANQGMLTDNLALDPAFVSAITGASASANDPDVSLYLMPNTSTLGLTIFTGGGQVTPELSFNVVSSVPEPSSIGLVGLFGATASLRRRRLN